MSARVVTSSYLQTNAVVFDDTPRQHEIHAANLERHG